MSLTPESEDCGYSAYGENVSIRVGGSTHTRTIREWHALAVAAFAPSETKRASSGESIADLIPKWFEGYGREHEQLAEALAQIRLLEAQAEWISADGSELPKDGECVLVFSAWDECIYTAYRNEGGWYHFCGNAAEKYRIRNVIRWKRTPEAPHAPR